MSLPVSDMRPIRCAPDSVIQRFAVGSLHEVRRPGSGGQRELRDGTERP